jgi:hypothetical protein
MTSEQRIRGVDAGVDWAVLLIGYGEEALMDLVQGALGPRRLEERGAVDVLNALYRIDFSLSHFEISHTQ